MATTKIWKYLFLSFFALSGIAIQLLYSHLSGVNNELLKKIESSSLEIALLKASQPRITATTPEPLSASFYRNENPENQCKDLLGLQVEHTQPVNNSAWKESIAKRYLNLNQTPNIESDADLEHLKNTIYSAALGFQSDDPEYRLNAMLDLAELNNNQLPQEIVHSMLELASTMNESFLQEVMLALPPANLDEQSAQILLNNLTSENTYIQEISFLMLANNPGNEPQTELELIEYTKQNPQILLSMISSLVE